MPGMPREWILVGYVSLAASILLWDVFLAGQIARARRQSRTFLALTAVCGLMVVPSALALVATRSFITGRALQFVSWLWPVTLACFVAQSGIALFQHRVTRPLGLPIFVFNVTLLAASVAGFVGTWWSDPPSALVASAGAQAAALGVLFGRVALVSPYLVVLPLLSPAYPARWRVSKSVRALLAMVASSACVLIVLEYPRAVHAADTFAGFESERLQERPAGDLALGLRLLPSLDGPPPAVALQRDLALADTLEVSVVSVVIEPDGATGPSLDSLALALADIRRDSVLLVASLGYGRSDTRLMARSPARYTAQRLRMVEQVVRRLRPDVLLPASDPMDDGVRMLGRVPAEWWRDYLRQSATLAHQLRPRTRVGFAVSAYTASDSALYDWGTGTPVIDLVGFSIAPSFGGGASLAARLRTAERWMRHSRKEQWVFAARGFPLVFGERNQERTLWGALAWATRQPGLKAFIVDGAGDYDRLTGLRAPNGRLRPAVAKLDRARRALDEAARDQR